MVLEEITFKDFFFHFFYYLELWRPFCSAELNHLCNFGRKYPEEQFCEIILNFGPVVQTELLFKRFLIWSSGSPPFQMSGTGLFLAQNNDGPLKWANGPYPIQIHAIFQISMGHLKFL